MPNRLNDLLALQHVPRWSIVRRSREQSVAEHSFNTAVIFMELCHRLSRSLEVNDLRFALLHDGPESRSGDMPKSFKEVGDMSSRMMDAEAIACPWTDKEPVVSLAVRGLVQIADLIEAYVWITLFGIGQHAQRVALAQTHYIETACRNCGVDDSVVWDVVNDILEDRGR